MSTTTYLDHNATTPLKPAVAEAVVAALRLDGNPSSVHRRGQVARQAVEQAASIKNTDIASHLALPPVKIHCSVLAEDAIKAAVQDYRHKRGIDADDDNDDIRDSA